MPLGGVHDSVGEYDCSIPEILIITEYTKANLTLQPHLLAPYKPHHIPFNSDTATDLKENEFFPALSIFLLCG